MKFQFLFFGEGIPTIVHVKKFEYLCGHVFGKSKSLTVKCASKEAEKIGHATSQAIETDEGS